MGDSSVRKFNYSGEAMKDLKKSLESIEDIYSDTLKIMVSRSKSEADSIRRRKEEVLDLDLDMRKAHLERVSRGNCDASLTAPFNSILHNIDRMSNSCVNIAEAARVRWISITLSTSKCSAKKLKKKCSSWYRANRADTERTIKKESSLRKRGNSLFYGL